MSEVYERAMPVCPRCDHATVAELFASPVPGVWEVLQCERCRYCWRTSEPDRRTRREAYPVSFRLTAEDIAGALQTPAIPPLRVPPGGPAPG